MGSVRSSSQAISQDYKVQKIILNVKTHPADVALSKLPATPTIGITYGTRDDFQYSPDDPWDWDAEFETSLAVGAIATAIEDLGFPTVMIGSAENLLEGFSEYRKKVHMVFNIAEGKLGRARQAQVPSILEA